MEISGRRIWQVAAGDSERNYAKLCLEWDVILNGRSGWGLSCKLADLERFCEEVKEGDLVVLRVGTLRCTG